MSTKHGFMPVSVSRIPIIVQSISRLAFLPFLKVCISCVSGLLNTTVTMSVWNLPASIGSRFQYLRATQNPGYSIPSEIHQTHERKQDRPQRCQMDL